MPRKDRDPLSFYPVECRALMEMLMDKGFVLKAYLKKVFPINPSSPREFHDLVTKAGVKSVHIGQHSNGGDIYMYEYNSVIQAKKRFEGLSPELPATIKPSAAKRTNYAYLKLHYLHLEKSFDGIIKKMNVVLKELGIEELPLYVPKKWEDGDPESSPFSLIGS